MRSIGRLWGLAAAMMLVALGAARAETGNLLVNGDAEAHRCTRDWSAQTPVPGWRVTRGAVTVLCYSAFKIAGETPALPAGAAGEALFSAPGADSAMEQEVDVSAASRAIDGGGVRFDLSGWLGGEGAMPDRAMLTLTFLDEEGRATRAPAALDGAGPHARGGKTALVARAASGAIPARTRRLLVTVDFLQSLYSFQDAFADNLSLTLTGADGLAVAQLAPPPAEIPALDHVFVAMMENTNYADVFHTDGRKVTVDLHMPFLASLAPQGVILSNMWGTYHPSDQNYVAMVAGDTFKFGPVYYPDYDLPVRHIGDLLEAKGKSWAAYVQHMGTPCNLQSTGNYSPDDEPFVQFHDVTADAGRCAKHLLPAADLAAATARGALPDFAWIAADNWWDGEGAWFVNFDIGYSLARQDQFLGHTLKPLLRSPAWRDSRSLLVITWDESGGWGWQDNHIPTLVVGSPGLLREGEVVDRHYDGYGVLRTAELALGLPSLGRFDLYAEPLADIFAGRERRGKPRLTPVEALATRGAIDQTFGRSTVGASVAVGAPAAFVGPRDADDFALAVTPAGAVPGWDTPRRRFDPTTGIAEAPTAGLAPGFYSAWLMREGGLPVAAARPFQVLAAPRVTPAAPGVEILGAPADLPKARAVANFIVRYCRPADLPAASTWIGIFAKGTPADQRTKANANQVGNWLRAPDENGAPCGEAAAYPAELAPGQDYEVTLFAQKGAVATPVGSAAAFRLTRALP